MRFLAPLLATAALLPTSAAVQGGGDDEAEIVVADEWTAIQRVYEEAHGGLENLRALHTMAFDFTVSLYDEDGEEVVLGTRKVEIRNRPEEGEARVVRIHEVLEAADGGEGIGVVALVEASVGRVSVWSRGADGEWIASEDARLLANYAADAQSILSILDLILLPDGADQAHKLAGKRRRDGQDYVAVDTEFAPARAVFAKFRRYFSSASALVERIDTYDAKTLMRIGTMRLSSYEDHGGLKVPKVFDLHDREDELLSTWRISDFVTNPELPEEHFDRP